MSEPVIRVTNVSKAYRIWKSPAARLKSIALHVAKHLCPPLWDRCTAAQARHYRDFYALQGISFEVGRGETLGIVGRNGSGKSTLLQIISGTLAPTFGTVEINGRVAALLELGSGFNPDFTGRENVFLNASILGLPEDLVRARFDDIEAFADIGDFIDQPVKTYSSGMLMRLAFSVIAHVDADVLIVDEALAVGDVFFVQKCMRFIREFQRRGVLVLVTHDTAVLTSLCRRAIWLHQGVCRGEDSAKEISQRYLEAVFEERQSIKLFGKSSAPLPIGPKSGSPSGVDQNRIDARKELLVRSNLRNDLQAFDFNPDSPAFGAGGARIFQVDLLDARDGEPLAYILGGEEVILRISAVTEVGLELPIMGFYLKNSLGQQIFGDNTFLAYIDRPIVVGPGQSLVGQFRFVMPYLPAGDYAFSVAIATGTQENHIQHHWLHEALVLRSQSSHVVGGLVGIPMIEINMVFNRSQATVYPK